jgi:aryl-alcohol dehydrogenase-like predicted oxidoreductase
MKYRRLGNSGIDVSVIGHGTWQLGSDFFGDVDEAEAIRAIQASIDHGVNLIDTAPGYGSDAESEKLVGRAIEGRRDKVVLSTKLGILRFYGAYVKCLDPSVMRKELELSLKRLKTDYIDVYFIHWPEYNNSIERALEEMAAMKKEGKIRAIGVSNFSVEQIQTAIDIADISCVQPQLSMLHRDSVADGVIPLCADKNVGIMTYGSLGGGILAGLAEKMSVRGNELRASFYGYYAEPMLSKCKELLAYLGKIADRHNATVAEVSINWALAQQGVTCALTGSKRVATAVANARAADWELSAGELADIEAEYKRIMG